MTTKTYHYTYKIVNKVTQEYYIGRRSCNINPSEDLGIKYFSSSSNTQFKNHQKTSPELFEYHIFKIFDNIQDVILSEIILHAIWQVKDDPLAINKANATDTKFDCTGYRFTEQQRKALSASHKGKTLSESHKANIRSTLKGITRKEITRHRISDANKGRSKTAHVQQILKQNSIHLANLRKEGWYKVTRIYDRRLMCVARYQQWLMASEGCYKVTRISDRKEMDLCQFMNWYNASFRIKSDQIMVTRLKDKKLLNLRQYKVWINGQKRKSAT